MQHKIEKLFVACSGCQQSFLKSKSEINRMIKRNFRNHFCSNSCQAKFANNGKGNINNLLKGKICDEYSPFRHFLNKVRSRHKIKGWKTDLTLSYLKDLWIIQNGICPITGYKMYLPKSSTEWDKGNSTPKFASLDRIQPKKPYIIGNVRYVCLIANMAKHSFTDEDVIEFAQSVVKNISQ
jgi:hypothetical protein